MAIKTDAIAKFLNGLKAAHKTGDFGFDIFCGKCGSKNCQVIVFPEVWQGEGSILDRGAVGIKCLDCGATKAVDYGEECVYG